MCVNDFWYVSVYVREREERERESERERGESEREERESWNNAHRQVQRLPVLLQIRERVLGFRLQSKHRTQSLKCHLQRLPARLQMKESLDIRKRRRMHADDRESRHTKTLKRPPHSWQQSICFE